MTVLEIIEQFWRDCDAQLNGYADEAAAVQALLEWGRQRFPDIIDESYEQVRAKE